MKYDQRVTIKFLLNEGIDAHDIANRQTDRQTDRYTNRQTNTLQAQFNEHAYKLRTIQFWNTELRLDCQGLYDEIRTGRLPLNDLDAKILMMLEKSPFKSVHSIGETLRVAHSIVLLHFA
jgi:hypothetical protein